MAIPKSPAPQSLAAPPVPPSTNPFMRRLRMLEKKVPIEVIKQRGSGWGASHMLTTTDFHLHGEVVDMINAGGPLPL